LKELSATVGGYLDVSNVAKYSLVSPTEYELVPMGRNIREEEDVRKLSGDVTVLNVLMVSLLIGFKAFRGLGKISMGRAKNEASSARVPLLK
jgi:hypothetical protein